MLHLKKASKEMDCKTRSPEESQYKGKRETREYGEKTCNSKRIKRNLKKRSQEGNSTPSIVIYGVCA